MKRLCATLLFVAWGFCALAAGEKSRTIVYINGAKYYIHAVQPGETLYGLAKLYGVGEKVIVENNPALAEGLKSAANIRIPVVAEVSPEKDRKSERKLRKTFDFHFVTKGETLYAISRQYEIPVKTIIGDNPGIDPTHLRPGERILIRRKQIGSEDEAGSIEQWEEYRRSLNSVADEGTAYHIVHPGETFYSLSRRFGITEAELGALNGGMTPADLKAGAMIKVPGGPDRTAALPSDSLTLRDSLSSLRPDSAAAVEFRALRRGEPLDIALLLPLEVGGAANPNYLEFYQGFLLGLDSVKRLGYSVNVGLYDTGRSPERIRQIVADETFRQADLVVGPVYETGLQPVLRFAEEKGIPVVSPLAHIERENSDVLFQLAPDPAHKYDKVADLVGPGKRVTLIATASTDREFEREMLALLEGRQYERYVFRNARSASGSGGNSPSDLTPLLENKDDNVFIILSDDEVEVDRILAALASADTNLTSRGRTAPRFTVLGNVRWNRYNNIDRTMFFKDRVVFISTYHAKRDAQAVTAFDSAYIRAFGTLPTLYSYRGYDSALIFAPAMYGEIEYDLEGRSYTPLQTTYRFGQPAGRSNHVNGNWTRVDYNKNFTITIQ